MEVGQAKQVAEDIKGFLDDHEVENKIHSVWIEKEWADFRITIRDPRQMQRINVWLQDDIKNAVVDWHDIEIAAPHPVSKYQDQLRVRIYYLDTTNLG